jgi:hypothetical protein
MAGSNGSDSWTATMETATMALKSDSPATKLTHAARRLILSISYNVFFWRHRTVDSANVSGTDTATPATSQEKGKIMIVGVTPVRSHDGSVTMVDGVIVSNSEAGGRRGSVSSAVVITGGRGRALDRERERGHARNGRSISSSTTVTSRRRSSLYYHHHLSKQYPHSGGGTAAKPLSTAAAASASDDSGLRAGAGVIKKRTEFWISEEELDRDDFDDDEEAFIESTKEVSEASAEKTGTNEELSGKGKDTAQLALKYVISSKGTTGGLSRGRSISNASTATAVDALGDVDVSSDSGSSTNHNNGSEEDLELGLHPPPRAHLS